MFWWSGLWGLGFFFTVFLVTREPLIAGKSLFSVMGGGICTQLWMQLADVIIYYEIRPIQICPQMQIWFVHQISGRAHRMSSGT